MFEPASGRRFANSVESRFWWGGNVTSWMFLARVHSEVHRPLRRSSGRSRCWRQLHRLGVRGACDVAVTRQGCEVVAGNGRSVEQQWISKLLYRVCGQELRISWYCQVDRFQDIPQARVAELHDLPFLGFFDVDDVRNCSVSCWHGSIKSLLVVKNNQKIKVTRFLWWMILNTIKNIMTTVILIVQTKSTIIFSKMPDMLLTFIVTIIYIIPFVMIVTFRNMVLNLWLLFDNCFCFCLFHDRSFKSFFWRGGIGFS